jgi:hypothetical protein
MYFYCFTKRAILVRWSIVLRIPNKQAFSGCTMLSIFNGTEHFEKGKQLIVAAAILPFTQTYGVSRSNLQLNVYIFSTNDNGKESTVNRALGSSTYPG